MYIHSHRDTTKYKKNVDGLQFYNYDTDAKDKNNTIPNSSDDTELII